MNYINILKRKDARLFFILAGIFITNALVAEMIGVKIFSLEKTLGLSPFSFSFFGEENLGFNLTVGVLLWPVVFVMTDIINEYFGERGVKFLSYLTVCLIAYAFVMFFLGIYVIPADFWVSVGQSSGVPNMNLAFKAIFGQGLWIIIGSIIAFLVAQIIDVLVFQKIKRITGEGKIWLRATGSTLVSQFIDSFVVLTIAFYIGANWSLSLVLAIGTVNYIFKFIVAILLTPVIYLAHSIIDTYLGKELAIKLKREALGKSKS